MLNHDIPYKWINGFKKIKKENKLPGNPQHQQQRGAEREGAHKSPRRREESTSEDHTLRRTAKHMNKVLSWWIYLLVSNLLVILYLIQTHTHAVLIRENDILHATQT